MLCSVILSPDVSGKDDSTVCLIVSFDFAQDDNNHAQDDNNHAQDDNFTL